jgi:hypothetical protein
MDEEMFMEQPRKGFWIKTILIMFVTYIYGLKQAPKV